MNIEEFRDFCLSLPYAVENQPWSDPRNQSLITYTIGGKWFCLLSVDDKRANIKCDPEKVVELQTHYSGAFPAWHMNKQHWVGVMLDSDIPTEQFRQMLLEAHDIVAKSLSRKIREHLGIN